MALTKAQAKSLSILDVARSLGMEMRRSSHKEYYWKEHDSFKIDTTKNTWNWYSRGIYGDTIDLVQEMRQVTYGQAIAFLDHGDYPEAKKQENVRQPFKYTLSPYEEPFNEARDYLKMVRGLSDETIDFFFNRGMLAQARRRAKDGYAESVLVFKSYSRYGEMVGASLQGLTPNKDRYEGKGYLKQIMYQSEGISGLNVAIGSPKRLVVAEAPIDLMSYYELHKETLEDVRLVAMDGLKEGLISHYAMELLQDLGEIKDETFDYTKSKDLQIASNFLKNATQQTTLFHNGAYQDLITLAVDNDKAGTDFLESLRDKDIPVIDARPPKEVNQEKMDWNEYLKQTKEDTPTTVLNALKSNLSLEGIGVDNDPTECVHTSTVDVEGYQLDLAVYSPHTELEPHGCYDWSLLVLEKTEPLGFLAYGEDWFNEQVTLKEKLTDLQTWLDQGTVKKHLLTQQDYTQFLELLNEKRQEEEETKKAPEQLQEATVSISEQTKKEGTNFSSGSLQLEAEGSPTPVVDSSTTFERSVTSRPTLSPHLLHFSINEGFKSSDGGSYQYINQSDLNKLNRRADIIQEAAQYYLNELANSKISYVTSQGSIIQVNFQEQNFMHLTGIKPLGPEQTPEKTLHDLASGNGKFENIMLANADGAFSKINVLPDLPVVLSLDAFYFDNLQDLRRYNGRFDSLLKTDDKDIMLLFRVTEQDGRIPVSLWEARNSHLKELQQTTKNEIVAIYREREGKVEQIALDEAVIKDGGKEIQSMLESKDFSPIRSTTLKEEVEQHSFKYDSDGDGISDEEELKQGTNPYDFRSTPSSKGVDENTLEPEETFFAADSVAVADLIKNKDITGLNQHLKEGIKAYLNSENYKKFLTKMSQFNQYSSRNLRLILAQKPDASYLAPYNTWKKFDRHVKRGEKALSVIIPVTYVKKDQQGHPILDKNGKPETGLTFRLKPTTFDVSQTEGKAMPKAAEVKEQLTDLDYANLYRALMSIAKTNNVSVRFEEMERSTFGYYNPTENQIVLRSNEMNKSQIIKTFLHETAHSELHHNNNPQQEQLTKSTAELQAESVAYVVASYYGIDTADYSFDYLAGWSNDKETLADLEAQLDIVQQEAKSLMVRMDQELEQLRLVQQRQSQQQFEQKLQKYKDQTKQAVEDHKKEMKEEAQSKKEKGLSK